MTARIVHPEFFPYTHGDGGVWRINEPIAEAGTLRELKAKLGRRYALRGYYPKGFRAPPWPEENKRVHMPLRWKPPQFVNPNGPRGPVIKYHEKILNLWRDGLTGGQIGARYGLSRGGVIGIVSRARERGDPRAIRHSHRGAL